MHTTIDSLRDLFDALVGLPAAIRDHWREAHRMSPWLGVWADVPMDQLDTDRVQASYRDYKLWRLLGRVSDAILLVIVALLVILLIGALI